MRENAMRPLLILAAFGSFLSVNSAVAQNTPAQPETKAQPEAGEGAKQGKPPARRHKGLSIAVATDGTVAEQRAAAGGSGEDTGREPVDPVAPASPAPVRAPVVPTIPRALPGPPQKNLTGDEFKLIHSGSSAKEVMTVLGPPSSRVVVPDDDGHLRETLEYWVKGAPAATIRLDNGRVIQIVTKPK
jgi:hypothetical protein